MPHRRREDTPHLVIRAGRRADDPPLDPSLQLLTIPQACRACRVGEKTFWKWINTGLVPICILPVRNFRVSEDDLREFIRRHLRRHAGHKSSTDL